MSNISPISKYYKGIKFRSRLEIHWAIFFDCYELEWVYEPKKFKLSEDIKYIPDFYFPELEVYAEIKPGHEEKLFKDISHQHFQKWLLFCKLNPLLLFFGYPRPMPFWKMDKHGFNLSQFNDYKDIIRCYSDDDIDYLEEFMPAWESYRTEIDKFFKL